MAKTVLRDRPDEYLRIAHEKPSVRLLHRPDASRDREAVVLASDVDVARTTLEQARGLMFRRSIPDRYALVFPFDGAERRWLHMLFVPFAIDAVWLVDNSVTRTKRLAPFVGLGRARADTIVELPAGAADDVAVGDEFVLRE